MPVHAEVTLIEKGRLQKIADFAAAVRQAVSEPINSPSLAELARGRKSVCILICDITDRCPTISSCDR
jgi:nickel-dependent lactate racemase